MPYATHRNAFAHAPRVSTPLYSPAVPGCAASPEPRVTLQHLTGDTDTYCWCEPEVREACPTCTGDTALESRDGCWRCDGAGTIPCELPEAYLGTSPLIVIHRNR